jgi:hypothetical protein
MTLEEFENRFNTEEACRDYLFLLRWPNGFICPKCGNTKAFKMSLPDIGYRRNNFSGYTSSYITLFQ